MSPRRPAEPYGAEHLIERQMLLRKVRQQLVPRDAPRESVHCRFVTVSRDVGSLGTEVAQEVGKRLDWHVYDREIVDLIAEEAHTRQALIQHLDETAQNLVEDTVQRLLGMVEGGSMGAQEYHEAQLHTLLTLGARSHVILVGRGGNFVLRDQPGVHVRIVASPEIRTERLRARWKLPPAATRKRMQQIDSERRQFIRRHFKKDWADPRHYDLVLNTDRISAAEAAEVVISLIKTREEREL